MNYKFVCLRAESYFSVGILYVVDYSYCNYRNHNACPDSDGSVRSRQRAVSDADDVTRRQGTPKSEWEYDLKKRFSVLSVGVICRNLICCE